MGLTFEVAGQGRNSRTFPINASVRQRCVFSLNFSSVLHWAMSKWRTYAEGCSFGFDLGDGLPPLSEFRFAADIFIFARFSHEIMTLLEQLVQFFGYASPKFSGGKKVMNV